MEYQEWLAQQDAGTEGDLPSGLTVRLKKVHILDLVASGTIPQTLQPMIERQMNVAQGGKPQTSMSIDELKSYHEMVGIVAAACLIDPPDAISRMDLTDKIAIYQWAMEDTKKLQSFRGKTPKSVESSPISNGVFPAPQRHRRARTK